MGEDQQAAGRAQDANVFGIPGRTIEILHLAGEHGFVDQHRITLTAPHAGTLCSPPFDTLDLLTEHLSGVDAALHALTVVAEHADQLLQPRPAAALAPVPTPTRALGIDNAASHVAHTSSAAARIEVSAADASRAAQTSSGPAPPGRQAFRPLAGDPVAAVPGATGEPGTGRRGRRSR